MGGKKRRASGHTAACATGTSALAAVRPLAARGVRRNAAGGSAPLRLSGLDLLCRDARQWRAASREACPARSAGGYFLFQFKIVLRSAAKRSGFLFFLRYYLFAVRVLLVWIVEVVPVCGESGAGRGRI